MKKAFCAFSIALLFLLSGCGNGNSCVQCPSKECVEYDDCHDECDHGGRVKEIGWTAHE